jgi:hypothetical protein
MSENKIHFIFADFALMQNQQPSVISVPPITIGAQ